MRKVSLKHSGNKRATVSPLLPKCPTGIQGLDEITGGGLPRGRPTLVCGGAGCGKTLLTAEFLVRGAVEFDEPGVLMAFEEPEQELKADVASLGFDLDGLVRRRKSKALERQISDLRYDYEGESLELRRIAEQVGTCTLMLTTSGILRQADANVVASPQSKHRPGRKNG